MTLTSRFVWLTALQLVITASPLTADPIAPARPTLADSPNIILLMADDLGWGDPGFQGNHQAHTPQLDAMASEGLVWRRFYAAAPVCSPTRGSVLTGRHPHRYGIDYANVGHLPENEVNLAVILRERGYRTAHFGKWHLGTLTRTVRDANRGGPRGQDHFAPPQLRGFDLCLSTESKVPTFDPLIRPEPARATWWFPLSADSPQRAFGTSYWNEQGESVVADIQGDTSRLLVRHALPVIDACVEEQRPFFLVIWFHAPHLPVVASEADRQPFADEDPYAQSYWGSVSGLDDAVGQLRQHLRVRGIAEKTLLAFCSDNGPEGQRDPQGLGAPGLTGGLRGRKRDLFEGGIRVPAILEWPGVIRPGTTDFPASTLDYLPTILDLVGLPQPQTAALDGISLRSVWEDGATQRSRPLFFYSQGRAAMIDQDWKWVRYPAGAGEGNGQQPALTQETNWLFRLDQDPQETSDLARQHPDRAAQMQDAFVDFLNAAQQDRED